MEGHVWLCHSSGGRDEACVVAARENERSENVSDLGMEPAGPKTSKRDYDFDLKMCQIGRGKNSMILDVST